MTVSRPPPKDMTEEQQKSLAASYKTVIKKVENVLEDKEFIKSILASISKTNEATVQQAIEGRWCVVYIKSLI